MKLTQKEKILRCILKNPYKTFTASDFQTGDNFIGYEASARISELVNLFPFLFEVGKVGRFRTIKLNPNAKEQANELIKAYKEQGLWEN